MVRTQSTPEGIRGIYVALPDGENPAAAFALKLDPQGREVSREALNRAGGMVREYVRPTSGPPSGTGPGRAGGRGRGFFGAGLSRLKVGRSRCDFH